MEIRKTLISSQNPALLSRQREISGVASKIDRISERLDVNPEGPGQRKAPAFFDLEEIHSALRALEDSHASAKRQAHRENAGISNRARQALDAYMTQQNLAREDDQRSLRQMLGVDYYA